MSKERGFTVIETVIVLAIAALILLIVLLAIPALERNSRNSRRKQDVQAILEAVSHWELNNSGNIPNPPSDNYLQYSKLNFYDPSNITIHGDASGSPPSIAGITDADKVGVYNYQKCSLTAQGSSTATGAGYSDIVALFAIETANSTASQCQQL